MKVYLWQLETCMLFAIKGYGNRNVAKKVSRCSTELGISFQNDMVCGKEHLKRTCCYFISGRKLFGWSRLKTCEFLDF